jgi:hypothetical protein
MRISSKRVTGKARADVSSMRAFDCTPSRESVIRPKLRQRISRPRLRVRHRHPGGERPADERARRSARHRINGTPASDSTFNTPTCAAPRAAPPDSASPTRNLLGCSVFLRHIKTEVRG